MEARRLKPERVVVINDFTRPNGGATVLARLAAMRYRARGCEVTYLTGEGSDAGMAAAGIGFVGLGAERLLDAGMFTALRQGYHNRAAAEMLGDWISSHDTPGTVYHLHNWSQILSPSIFGPLQRVEARTLVSCHDFFNVCPNGAFLHFGRTETCTKKPLGLACLASQCDRRSPLHKYWRTARQWHVNGLARFSTSAMGFVALHEGMEQTFRDRGFAAPHLFTVRNPCEPYTEARVEAENNRGVLFVGRIGQEKGADLALEACAKAGVPVTLCGTGEDSEALSARFPGAHFAGWCDRDMIAEHAARSRLVVVPSRWREPFGLVALEGALSGLPVVIADNAYLAPELEAIGAGRGVRVTDTDAFAKAITAIHADDALAAEMSHNAFNRAGELCLSPEDWGDAFLARFAERLHGRGIQTTGSRTA